MKTSLSNAAGTMSTAEAARALNVSRTYVVRLADAGVFGAVEKTEGGSRRISAAAVNTYREQRQSESRNALRDLAAASQEAGLYNIRDEKMGD